MANENDVTDGFAARENAATQRARQKALPDSPLTAEALAEAIAKAQERVIENAGKVKEKPLPEIVRASVRCGFETKLLNDDHGKRYVTSPKSVDFKADETADGRPATIPHGRPARLKRDAFLRYQSEGLVILAG
jgi:hypothetical protein